jgi:FlaA1/EpsC-like NDP-sugar epimerase
LVYKYQSLFALIISFFINRNNISNMAQKSVLVTGGAGYIGKEFTRSLYKKK